jgi:hypothetical protein
MGCFVRKLLPRVTAANARRLLGNDVGATASARVIGFDQDPLLASSSAQTEPAVELAAAETEGDMVWLVTQDLDGAFVPHDHRAAAAELALMDAFEIATGQAVVFYLHGEAAYRGVE